MTIPYSATPQFSHCYALDPQGHRIAHRVIVFRNWAKLTFQSYDGFSWEPLANDRVVSSAGVRGILGYAADDRLDEVLAGIRMVMSQVEPLPVVIVDEWCEVVQPEPRGPYELAVQARWDARKLARATKKAAGAARAVRL